MTRPQKLWPVVPKLLASGGTVVCLAGGPSLTQADVDYCRDKVDAVIAINNAYQLAPWATALYAADARWWTWHKGARHFEGLKYSLTPGADKWPGVHVLKNTGHGGLEHDPSGLRTGRNGGYQAVNLAVHFGATRIVLLGYDMQRGRNGREHWHDDHPVHVRSSYAIFVEKFKTLVRPLEKMGIEVVNCTPESKLTCFPMAALRDTLPEAESVTVDSSQEAACL